MDVYKKIERLKTFIKYFFEKYTPKCHFCGENLTHLSFFPIMSGLWRDEFAIHHIDEDRSNNSIENLAICHRGCHKRHHRENELMDKIGKKKVKKMVKIVEYKENVVKKR